MDVVGRGCVTALMSISRFKARVIDDQRVTASRSVAQKILGPEIKVPGDPGADVWL